MGLTTPASMYVYTKMYYYLGRNKGGFCQIQNKTQLKMKLDASIPCDQDLILRILGMKDVYVWVLNKVLKCISELPRGPAA